MQTWEKGASYEAASGNEPKSNEDLTVIGPTARRECAMDRPWRAADLPSRAPAI